MSIYNGYEVRRNRLDDRYYAYPVGDLTTCRRIVCSTSSELKAAIDAATTPKRLNPWELPRKTA